MESQIRCTLFVCPRIALLESDYPNPKLILLDKILETRPARHIFNKPLLRKQCSLVTFLFLVNVVHWNWHRQPNLICHHVWLKIVKLG